METKKSKGQFYTVRCHYILEDLPGPPPDARCIVEPFAGQGDLLKWLETGGFSLPVEAYDIDPKKPHIVKRDTLRNPPDYSNAWILTNPPYLARNKTEEKDLFDLYETNDLYKCFLKSLTQQTVPARGGILIIPAGFFFSPRALDLECRDAFLSRYRILGIRYFEETVFPDTTTTVVAFAFERSDEILTSQTIEWTFLPSGLKQTFKLEAQHSWIVGGEIYSLPNPSGLSIRRHVEGVPIQKGEQLLSLTLNALDSGTEEGRISLDYKKGYVYPALHTSRTYATLVLKGTVLSEENQISLAKKFNTFLEKKREETKSLFLPQYRESKEYARKRIPFELAYRIILHLLSFPEAM